MNFVPRQRTAIELPARRMSVFAMAGETPPDLAAFMATFGQHHDAVTQKFGAIEDDMDKIHTALASMRVLGGGGDGAASSQANLRAEINAITKYFKKGEADEVLNIHKRAVSSGVWGSMSVGSDPDGGYLVFPEISKTMTTKLFDVSPMRRICRVEQTAAGEWQEPADIGEVNYGWVGETDSRPQTGSPQLAMLKVPLNELYAMPAVTQSLLDTAYFDLGAWLTGKVSDKFARSEGAAFVTGDGQNKPFGFLSSPQSTAADATRPWGTLQYTTTGQAGAFAGTNPGDCLKTLVFSLRAPYRAGANWLMNSTTLSLVDKLKDAQGQYLLRPGLAGGMPDTLLGYPVVTDDVAMPDVAANSFSIAFGNFKLGYIIIDGIGIRLIRDPYTAKPYVLFYAYRRVGGQVANSEAIKLLKFA